MKRCRSWLVAAGFAIAGAGGCALPARVPLDPPMPSGGARWIQGSRVMYADFTARSWDYGRFTPDDKLEWSRLANPTDEVWRWKSATGPAGYALVRDGRVLTVAVTDWGLRGK